MATTRRSLETGSAMALALLAVGIARPVGAAGGRGGPEQDRGVRIAGRVVDDRGTPLVDVLVQARTSSMGELLWWAFKPATRTDATGRFELALPFRGIRYALSARKMGYHDASRSLVPEKDQSLALTLRPARSPRILGGIVLGADGRPVAGASVRLIGEYGLRGTTRTDEGGRFRFAWGPGYIGQAVPVVREGGLVAPLQIVRRKGADVVLTLGRAARLKGVVHDKDDGKPLPGATVIIRPTFASGFRMETTSADDGTFELTGIPPGKYHATAVSPTHFERPPRGASHNLPELRLAAGQTHAMAILLQRVATARGRVVGPKGQPEAGALVAIRSTWFGDYRDQNRYVQTDEHGRFAISTGHLDAPLPFVAYSARHGLAQMKLQPLSSGDSLGGVLLQLPGAVRVRGVVTDPRGRPIKDVLCLIQHHITVSVHTDATGRFDLGRVTLVPDPRLRRRVTFRAPRPQRGELSWMTYSFDSKYYPVKGREGAPQFFHHRRLSFQPDPKGEINLKVGLQPTQLLEFTGTVVDGNGQPSPDAQVHLFTGDANPETWLQTLHPPPGGDREGVPTPRNTVLNATRTDARGRWQFWAVRERGDAMVRGGLDTDWATHCIGVQAPGGRSKLVRNIVVPKGQPRVELTTALRE